MIHVTQYSNGLNFIIIYWLNILMSYSKVRSSNVDALLSGLLFEPAVP